MNFLKNFSFLFNRQLKVKFAFILIIFFTVLIVALDAFSILTLLPIISSITVQENIQENLLYFQFLPQVFFDFINSIYVRDILLFLILILFLRNIVYIAYEYLIFKFVKILEIDTYKKLFFIFLKKSYLNFYKQNTNEVIKNFQVSVIQYLSYVEVIAKIVSDLIIISLYFIILTYLSFKETLLIFVYFTIIFLVAKKFISNFSFKYGQLYNQTTSQLNLSILNTFKNFSQIILKNLEKKISQNFISVIINHSFSRLIMNVLKTINRQILEISILILVIVIVLFYKDAYSFSDLITLATIYLASAYRLMPVVNSFITSYVKIKNYKYGFKIIDKEIDFFNNRYKKIKFTIAKKKKIIFKKELHLKKINFSHKNTNSKLFHNLDFKIKKNQMIGIIGTNGSGKTSLMQILLSLIKPNSGKIIVDNKQIEFNNTESYRKLFSYLPQENFFINGTIKENITFGDENVNKNKLMKALDDANCLSFVKKLKNNINHIMSENGKNFSLGQLQRLALARALYFDNEILILDEPTSSLDLKAEKKFLLLIKKLKKEKTIIIISHRNQPLKRCDVIYKLKRNKLFRSNKRVR